MNIKKNVSIRERGVALLISLFSIMMLSFIAVEVSYDTSIDYIISSREYHKLRAYYAAKSGVELSLLRILMYKKAQSQFKQQLSANPSLVDTIWNFPFSWPVDIPEDLAGVDQQGITEVSKESLLEDVQYQTMIQSEGVKIDINSLAAANESLANSIKVQLASLFRNYIDSLEESDSEIEDVDYERVIENIKDWVDADDMSFDNRDEKALYEDPNLPYNRAFRTLEELRMVSGVTDRVFNFLKPSITVYGVGGVNPNKVSKVVLRSVHSTITDEIIDRMNEHFEQSGPFKNEDDFFGFLSRFNVNVNEIKDSGIRLYFSEEGETNFLIKSVGKSGVVNKEVQVVVYDRDKVKSILGISNRQAAVGTSTTSTTSTTASGGKSDEVSPAASTTSTVPSKVPQGRPEIIYWYES